MKSGYLFPKQCDEEELLDWSDSLRKLSDLYKGLCYLLRMLAQKEIPLLPSPQEFYPYGPPWMRYAAIPVFRQQLSDVRNELSNNLDANRVERHLNAYHRCHKTWRECIKALKENRNLMEFDMSGNEFRHFEFDDHYRYEQKANWYKLVYNELVKYEEDFSTLLCFVSNKVDPSSQGVDASNTLLAMLLFVIDPETKGERAVKQWLVQNNFPENKANAVYKDFRLFKNDESEMTRRKSSVHNLHRLKTLIEMKNLHDHLPKVNNYLREAKNQTPK